MHPPPAIGLKHGRAVGIACHVQGVPDDLLVVPAVWKIAFFLVSPYRAGGRRPTDRRPGCARYVPEEGVLSPVGDVQGG